jgi:predicted metal-dependent hydrolase
MAFPTYDIAKHGWAPQVEINSFVGPSHDSTFVRFPSRFLTEDEAVNWALARGQAWIDKRLERLQSRAPKRRRMFDMIEAFNDNLAKARPQQPRPALAVPKRPVKARLTFEEFAHLLAQKRFTFSVKTLHKSYTALVKVKKIKRWSWAETKRKVMRAQQTPAPAGAPRRIPLSERAWGRIH